MIVVVLLLFVLIWFVLVYFVIIGVGVLWLCCLLMGWLGVCGIGIVNYFVYVFMYGLEGDDVVMVMVLVVIIVVFSVILYGVMV